jgi:hypothetical protein
MGMTASELIPVIALFICQAALLAALPILVFAGATRLVNSVQDARLPWTPYIELAAMAIGIAAGAIILRASIDPATITPGEVFRVGGPWDLDFLRFLTERANPFAYDIWAVLPVPFSSNLPSGAGLLVFFLSGIVIYAPILRFRSRRAIANGIRNAVIMILGAYVTIYGFAYFFWLLNKLNFWIFLFLLLLIHMRSRSQAVVLKLN